MRFRRLKLSGFKSFVEPASLAIEPGLTGVVGPNGCGKSNLLEAIRWVMGESAASRLRGDSLTDVIFSGSTARKPVSQATVELVFDNSDHTITGEFAEFNEISVKRTVSRDATSNYYLNGARCRRRDITDLFLGTGLGPRSYSIIEQGMISQIIEARPEDLRVYLEEAAGISKYKERRKETETRIKHTRENLERLTDLREEVDKQLEHLRLQIPDDSGLDMIEPFLGMLVTVADVCTYPISSDACIALLMPLAALFWARRVPCEAAPRPLATARRTSEAAATRRRG